MKSTCSVCVYYIKDNHLKFSVKVDGNKSHGQMRINRTMNFLNKKKRKLKTKEIAESKNICKLENFLRTSRENNCKLF